MNDGKTFKEAYGTLQKHAQALRSQQEPDIDNLTTIVTESVAAYKVCKQRIDAVEKALAHIEDAKAHGGKVEYGGKAMEGVGPGYFLQPTVITGMTTEMLTTREETFAPVVALYKFETEEEVIERANDCDVGLGSFVITSDIARSWRMAEALEVG